MIPYVRTLFSSRMFLPVPSGCMVNSLYLSVQYKSKGRYGEALRKLGQEDQELDQAGIYKTLSQNKTNSNTISIL